MKINAVFEGGGVKGIAYVGAIQQIEAAGYELNNLAGSSAGSIAAALLAAGFTGDEIMSKFLEFPLSELIEEKGITKLPFIGPWLSLELLNGIYSLSPLEKWLSSTLKEKGIFTFGDLPKEKLKIIVSDLTQNKMAVFPDDLPSYGINPEAFPIAQAVRMSSTIPLFFRPLKLSGNVMIDGGILSNYPIWLFDKKSTPHVPTFGFRLSGPPLIQQPKHVRGLVNMSNALIKTMMEAHDRRYIDSNNAARTIFIKGITVSATEFNITNNEKIKLIELGKEAVKEFLLKRNFKH